jgi:hypothetical protein
MTVVERHGPASREVFFGVGLRNWPQSPTFQKERCIKSINLSDDTHIFGTKPNSFTLNTSFEETADQRMNVSMSSSTRSWPMSTEKAHSSFGSIGLPSEYPTGHRKSKSLTSTTTLDDLGVFDEFFDDLLCKNTRRMYTSLTSTTLDDLDDFDEFFGDFSCKNAHIMNTSLTSTTLDDLDDFDEFFDDLSSKNAAKASYSTIGQNSQHHPLKTNGSVLKTKPQSKPRHRRQRTEITSTQNYLEIVAGSNQQRRRRNHALCAKDFHETILKVLFANVSPDAPSLGLLSRHE